MDDKIQSSAIEGGKLTLKLNDQTISLSFDDTVYSDPSKLVEDIESQLADKTISLTSGGSKPASEMIEVTWDSSTNTISFSSNGNTVTVTSASDAFNHTDNSISTANLVTEKGIADQKLSVTVDGNTKSISLEGFESTKHDFEDFLQDKIDATFGDSVLDVTYANDGTLSYAVREGSSFNVSSTLGNASNYVNTNRTLADMGIAGDYTLTINNMTKTYSADTTLATIMQDINKDANSGVTVSYSKITNEFLFTARETGSRGEINFGGIASQD